MRKRLKPVYPLVLIGQITIGLGYLINAPFLSGYKDFLLQLTDNAETMTGKM
jgi:hypothetical protein